MTSDDEITDLNSIRAFDCRFRRLLDFDRFQPTGAKAFVDKMELRFNRSNLRFTDPGFLRTLHQTLCINDERMPQLLTRGRQYGGNSYKFTISQNWLFKGIVQISQRNNDRASVEITLELNCARFVAHCAEQFTTENAIEHLAATPAHILLRKDASRVVRISRGSLDARDNYFRFSQNLLLYSRLSNIIQVYIIKTLSLITSYIQVLGQLEMSPDDYNALLEQGFDMGLVDDVWIRDRHELTSFDGI